MGVVNLYRVYQNKTSDRIEKYDCLFIHYSKTDDNQLYNYLDSIADKTLFNLFYNQFFYHNKIISDSDDWFVNKLDYHFNMYKFVFGDGTIESKIEEIRNLYKDKFFSKLINKTIDKLTEEEKSLIRMYYL